MLHYVKYYTNKNFNLRKNHLLSKLANNAFTFKIFMFLELKSFRKKCKSFNKSAVILFAGNTVQKRLQFILILGT